MRATALEIQETTALVLLEPGPIDRLILRRRAATVRLHFIDGNWQCAVTRRRLHFLPFGSKIENALSLRAIPQLPRATATEHPGRAGSWLAPEIGE